MPYDRPTLSTLRQQVAADQNAELPGTDALLRHSNLNIMGRVQAALAHGHYGYLDWIARMAVPFTAEDEFLEGHAALKKVYRKPATYAIGAVTIPGTNGATIPLGRLIIRGDGVEYTSTAAATVASGIAIVPVIADIAGANGNADTGTVMVLGTPLNGVQSSGAVSSALTGGSAVEKNDALRNRMLLAYANPPQGGSKNDYRAWALEVPGVTRAWCNPNGAGAGTIVIYPMFDLAQAVHDGFPQGTNGGATDEDRIAAATGDQLAVANHLYSLRPATALVYVIAPVAAPQNFIITGLSGASMTTQTAIAAAIEGVFATYGEADVGVVELSYIESALAAIPATTGFVITAPTANITTTMGSLPTLGIITYV